MARQEISGKYHFRVRRLVAGLVIVVVSSMVSLALAEVAARFFAPREACLRFQQNVKELHHVGLNDLVVESDPELFWRLAPNQSRPADGFPFRGVISNGQGLRADHEIPLKKPPGEIRILFLGDSCTFGHGLLHTETFVSRVEQMLRAQFPNARLQCINAGVPGYSLFQGVRFLETQGARYQADLVVANFGFNDNAPWDNRSDLDHYRQWLASRPIPALRWSRLCQLAWEASANPGKNSTAPRPRLTGTEFYPLLLRLHQVASEQGSSLLLVALPYRINLDPRFTPGERLELQGALIDYGHNILRLDLQSDGIVDLIPLLRDLATKHPVSELMFDQVHPTGMVNEQYARAIVAKLQPWVISRLNQSGRPPSL